MAAQKETQEETVTTSEVTQTNVDYGSLTQKEIEEFNSIYDRLDAIDKEVMKDADGWISSAMPDTPLPMLLPVSAWWSAACY